jgi:cytochrome P450
MRPRACIGARFVFTEATRMLVKRIAEFRAELIDRDPVPLAGG